MSFLAQVGVVVLIAVILAVLYVSNKSLEKAAEEGEHFVDEWALREERREALRLARRRERKERRQEKSAGETANGTEDAGTEEPEEDAPTPEQIAAEHPNIIPMVRKVSTGITLYLSGGSVPGTRQVSVDRIPFLIGRDGKCNLVLDDICVAREHCRIVEEHGMYFLEDLKSANQIAYAGAAAKRIALSDGLRFFIGDVECVVILDSRRSQPTRRYPGREAGYYYE